MLAPPSVHGTPARSSRIESGRIRACHPCREYHSCGGLLLPERDFGDTDHRIARHERGELVLAHFFRTGWTLGQHQIAQLGCTIPHPYLDFVRQLQPELAEDSPRIDY